MANSKGTYWILGGLTVAVLMAVIGFAAGFHVRQPMLIAESVKEARTAAEQLDRASIEAQRDPRDVAEQLVKLRAEARKVREKERREQLLSQIDSVDRKLDEQSDKFESALWTTHSTAQKIRDNLEKQARASSDPVVTAFDQSKRLLKWLGPTVAAGLLLLLLLVAFPGPRRWLSRAQSVSLGGLAINVHDPSAVREGVRERYHEVDAAMSAVYIEKLEKVDVDDLFVRFKRDLDEQFQQSLHLELSGLEHRATLWIPGFVAAELVQATRYLGTKTDARPVVGRRFSVRYGIIGRACRLRTTQYNWDVSNDANALIRNWGLTRAEARKQGDQHSSLMAFVIPSEQAENDPLGVFYLEAAGVNSLMPSKPIAALEGLVPNDPNGLREADRLAHDLIWAPLIRQRKHEPLAGALKTLRNAFNWDLKVVSGDGR